MTEERETSARHFLRQATDPDHQDTEAQFHRFDLAVTADYRRFLEIQCAAVAPLEAWMEANGVARCLPDWPNRRRMPALRADLNCLGGRVLPLTASGLPAPSIPALFGVLYVLEGSRLGGKILVKRAAQCPAHRPATSFLCHGDDANLWGSFLRHLEAALGRDDDRIRALAASRFAFGMFRTAVSAAPATDRIPAHV